MEVINSKYFHII